MSDHPTRTPAPAPGEPIAVAGMACRFPGADDLGAFWRLLTSGGQAIAPGTGRRAGRRPGGYLRDVERFDAEFFGISPREAAAADPQQRLLLELCWHALEDARIAPDSWSGLPVGVFVGACADEYAYLTRASGPPTSHTMPGTGRGFLANRLSYAFGFTGPSLAVDCGPASSLAALQQAMHGLRRGEFDTAIVAGVQLNLTAEGDQVIEALGALSAGGRCHTFDERADGIVRGEGAGVLVLKPLSAVDAGRDRVYCTVLGGATNNDGTGSSLTAPSRAGQRDLLAAAYRAAGVSPQEVGYVELHGTGTALGDPVEAAALGGVLGQGRPVEAPLLVGSVKTNIGHLEGAAGVAGFIKTALSLFHRELPASLNFRRPNPAIDLAALRLRVCDQRQGWPPAGRTPLVAGVSAFGLGGTNCHVVLAEAPRPADTERRPEAEPKAVPVLVSGPSPAALRRQAAAMAGAARGGLPALADLGLSSATTRTAFRHRGAVVAATVDELVSRLRVLADGAPGTAEGVVEGVEGDGRTVFLFPGQGVQRPGMGQRLHKEFTVFARAFDAACAALEPVLGVSIKDAMWGGGDSGAVDASEYAQPALFAIEVALYRLLESWNLTPDLVIGHSRGEISAAHVAGVLSLEDAATLVAQRARLIGGLPPGGAMVAIQAEEAEVRAVIAGEPGLVGIAAVNSPQSLVVSGEERATLRVADHFAALSRKTRRLRNAVAGHSPLMAPIREELRAVAESLTWHPPTGPAIVSTVTGRPVTGQEFGDPGYWPHHLCATVRFGPAVQKAHELGGRFFVELGPGRGLIAMVGECVADGGEHFAAPLATDDEVGGVAETAARAFVFGAPIDWPAVHGPRAQAVDLPLYPFAGDRHWLDTPLPDQAAPEELPAPRWTGDPLDLVVDCTFQVLGRNPDADLDLSRPFNDLGLDSLMAVQLRNALATATGRRLPATLLFDHPTPAALSEALRSGDPI
ncbi:type I polyketide synthase [Nonomuraea sp. NPDC046570]|uniref:type I polyketide synthase n=1 Tax=Nonomuraea sp. NPDC046570 TaxID=3155255 RepID=UPI0033CE2D42